MRTREWLSKDNVDVVMWPDEDGNMKPETRPRWGGLMTTHRDGSQVLELHKERRFALLQENLRRVLLQSDQPDRRCITLPDGNCAQPLACMHSEPL